MSPLAALSFSYRRAAICYVALVDELVRRARVRWIQVAVERVDRADGGWRLGVVQDRPLSAQEEGGG